MRHIPIALLSAGAIVGFACATPVMAQTIGAAPASAAAYNAYGYPYGLTRRSHTGTPAYSWHTQGPWYAPGGECQILSGNHVCTSNGTFGSFVGL